MKGDWERKQENLCKTRKTNLNLANLGEGEPQEGVGMFKTKRY